MATTNVSAAVIALLDDVQEIRDAGHGVLSTLEGMAPWLEAANRLPESIAKAREAIGKIRADLDEVKKTLPTVQLGHLSGTSAHELAIQLGQNAEMVLIMALRSREVAAGHIVPFQLDEQTGEWVANSTLDEEYDQTRELVRARTGTDRFDLVFADKPAVEKLFGAIEMPELGEWNRVRTMVEREARDMALNDRKRDDKFCEAKDQPTESVPFSSAGETEEKRSTTGASEIKLDAQTRALAILASHPELTSIKAVADKAKCTREHLSKNCPNFMAAWKVAKESKRNPRRIIRGSKDRDGNLEAIQNEPEQEK